jgi:hypothetical protein
MRTHIRSLVLVSLVAAGGVGVPLAQLMIAAPRPAQVPPPASAVTAKVVASAEALLATLDPQSRAKIQFPLDSPQKSRWSNLPSPMFERQGVRMGDLTPTQRAAAMALVQTALSPDGYRKVTEIMGGDETLKTSGGGAPPRGGPPAGADDGRGRGGPGRGNAGRGGPGPGAPGPGGRGGSPSFGKDSYYLAFVGTPSVTSPWMLQFGGHHLAINLTIAGSRATLAPTHVGAQPTSYTIEGRDIRPLGAAWDTAYKLLTSLDAEQRRQAILDYRVPDLVLGPGQDGRTIAPEGLRADSMSASQKALLVRLVHDWAGIAADAYAEPRMDEITSGLSQTYFAWSGAVSNDGTAYFRVQGPEVVIEYAPQGGSDHVHTIYRDPTNDYGVKFAAR